MAITTTQSFEEKVSPISATRRPAPNIPSSKNSPLKSYLGIGAVIVIIVLLGYFGFTKFFSGLGGISPKKYQAVFLSNGQTFFGKVKGGVNGSYVTLTDIYYLIYQEAGQTAVSPTQEGNVATGSAQKRPNFTLIKLGDELHGPEDKMLIRRDNILFIEDLKDEGKVAQAIINFKKEQAGKK